MAITKLNPPLKMSLVDADYNYHGRYLLFYQEDINSDGELYAYTELDWTDEEHEALRDLNFELFDGMGYVLQGCKDRGNVMILTVN